MTAGSPLLRGKYAAADIRYPGGNMDQQKASDLVASIARWHHKFEIFPGVFTPGTYGCEAVLKRLQLPEDLSGARVLDIGSCDGFFSMVCASRGADVTALDYASRTGTGFAVMEEITGLRMRHIQDNLWNLADHNLGTFDIVLFLGVLYHLPDPYRGMCIVANHCGKHLYLETACEDVEVDGKPVDKPLMEFTPDKSWDGDITNFWRPNPACLRAMVEDAEFAIEREFIGPLRMVVHATRTSDELLMRRKQVAYGLHPV
jgi:tRNA (mo5U34)-methyltransferase